MTAFVSLLRAVNVGGRNIVRMTDLKALHESLGLKSVRTVLQSGNVVFTGPRAAAALSHKIEAEIARRLGLQVTVMVRSADELEGAIAGNPFADVARSEPKRLLVMFLQLAPDQGAADRLGQAYSGPERFELAGRELFLHYPAGVGTSKLTNALIEKRLGVAGTARNWNTVIKLKTLMEAVARAR